MYIKYKIKDANLSLMLKGVVQYVGSILIIGHVFRYNKDYRYAVKRYFDYLNDHYKNFFKAAKIIKIIIFVIIAAYLFYLGLEYIVLGL